MPSWPIHLALANKINKKLNLGDEFIFGNVMPDILGGFMIENPSKITEKTLTHFQDKDTRPPRINIDKFLNKYKNNLDNPFIKGYLSHLMTDKFFNEYTYDKHYFFNSEKFKAILNDGTIDNSGEIPWRIKQKDFEIFDQKLINRKILPIINKKIKNFDVIEECFIDINDLNKTVDKINSLNDSCNDHKKNEYRMFTEGELEKLYEECYQHICDKLKSL